MRDLQGTGGTRQDECYEIFGGSPIEAGATAMPHASQATIETDDPIQPDELNLIFCGTRCIEQGCPAADYPKAGRNQSNGTRM